MGTPELRIPVGAHLFTPEALKSALDRTLPQLPAGKTIALAGALDASGATVAVLFQSTDGHWQAKAAVAHDWTGDTSIGAQFSFIK